MRLAHWMSVLAVSSCLAVGAWSAGPALADGMRSAGAPQEAPERGVWFGGYDFVKGSSYYFDGLIVALNGDLSRDGFALRAYGSRVDYDLDPGDGRGYQGDLMLGYLFTRGQLSGGVFVGVDYQDYKLKPDDPTAQVRGTEVGFAVAANLDGSREGPFYFSLNGKYSTAFESYWGRARVGLNRGRFTFGPEAIAFGDVEFDAQRLGGFLTFDVKLIPRMPLEVTLSAGHQYVSGSGGGGGINSVGGGEGTYGLLVVSTTF
jgi:hypothetical protein